MLIPVRCFTCNKIICDKLDKYNNLIKNGFSEQKSLDMLNLNRICCRRMILTNVNYIDMCIKYN